MTPPKVGRSVRQRPVLQLRAEDFASHGSAWRVRKHLLACSVLRCPTEPADSGICDDFFTAHVATLLLRLHEALHGLTDLRTRLAPTLRILDGARNIVRRIPKGVEENVGELLEVGMDGLVKDPSAQVLVGELQNHAYSS